MYRKNVETDGRGSCSEPVISFKEELEHIIFC